MPAAAVSRRDSINPMKTSLLFSLALAVALTGCNKSSRSSSTDATDTTRTSDYTATTNTASTGTSDRVASDVRNAANSAGSAISSAASNVATTARMAEWKLTPNDIQADLDNHREIVRTKDTAGMPAGTSDKSVLKSMVKGRLEADSSLAALKLDVNVDKGGAVELEGKAPTAEQIGRAIALALDTEGVSKVTSKIKLDK